MFCYQLKVRYVIDYITYCYLIILSNDISSNIEEITYNPEYIFYANHNNIGPSICTAVLATSNVIWDAEMILFVLVTLQIKSLSYSTRLRDSNYLRLLKMEQLTLVTCFVRCLQISACFHSWWL